jgi:hypothetical protein
MPSLLRRIQRRFRGRIRSYSHEENGLEVAKPFEACVQGLAIVFEERRFEPRASCLLGVSEEILLTSFHGRGRRLASRALPRRAKRRESRRSRETESAIPRWRQRFDTPHIDHTYFRVRKNSDSFSPSATCVSILSKLVTKYTTAIGIVIPKTQSKIKMTPLPCHSYRVTLSIVFPLGMRG